MNSPTSFPFTTSDVTLELDSTVDLLDALNFCRDGAMMIGALLGDVDGAPNQSVRHSAARYLESLGGTLDAIRAKLEETDTAPAAPRPKSATPFDYSGLERADAILTFAEKLKAHFAALHHQDKTDVLNQPTGFAICTALVALASALIEEEANRK